MKQLLSNSNVLVFSGAFATIALGFYLISPYIHSIFQPITFEQLSSFEVERPNVKFGFNLNNYEADEREVKNNEIFSKILMSCIDDHRIVHELLESTKDVFDTRKLRAGKEYLVIRSRACGEPLYLIYDESPYSYVQYDFNQMCAEKIDRKIDTRYEVVTGTIEKGSSLYQSMVDAGIVAYQALTSKMEKALAWSVDFHHLQEGDRYKLYYEKVFVDGVEIGVGELKAAYFKNNGKDYYSFKYQSGELDGYYDENGRSAKKTFLKAPLEFSRISSGYNLRRFHPVLRRMKAHLGTDYAAPSGTPILAVADGTVLKAEYGRGNGNYVKIKHDKTYETQYLHMSRFHKGVRSGSRVKQGDIIGYVGSTGLATGPHVCFRFWKNGKQVNHLKENLPNSAPMPGNELPKYKLHIDSLMQKLNATPFLDDAMAGACGDQQKNVGKP
ncbi:MAG: peptidoglycan DD-metalloendopeptidase family protein [Saprospiraceae bacterium]|nr:peptidoglycan DD-metalloendopeptidase family protein [Saprospiraceae bacterium]